MNKFQLWGTSGVAMGVVAARERTTTSEVSA